MDQIITLEPIRSQDVSARITIIPNNSHPKVYYQVLSFLNLRGMCLGRPVEELPRILSILSPSHHLVSAMALDRLCKVKPPELAINMRQALLQTHYFVHHLRKLAQLLTSWQNPFSDFHSSEADHSPRWMNMIHEIMHYSGLCQEAAAILGGRYEHPLTAIAGGVSRFLKDVHYPRLVEIAAACLDFSKRLTQFFETEVLQNNVIEPKIRDLQCESSHTLCMDSAGDAIVLKDSSGKDADRFSADQLFDKIVKRREKWSYQPFAYVKSSDSAFAVGPIARTVAPDFSVAGACKAYLAELLQTAERMKALFTDEKLSGAELRTIPTRMGTDACAALEAPEGLIFHHYTTDSKGIIQDIGILDAVTANNAIRCRMAEKIVRSGLDQHLSVDELKHRAEISLIFF